MSVLLKVNTGYLFCQKDENLYSVLKRHSDAVNAVIFSGDGNYLASGGEDKSIYIWNFSTGEVEFSITDNFYPVKSLQFAPGDELLVSSGPDVKIVDYSGNLKKAFGGYTTHIWSFDFNDHTKKVIAGSYSKKVNVWDFFSGEIIASLDGHEKNVLAVCFSPDGRYAVTGSLDRTVRVWDADSAKELQKLERHSDNILAVQFHPSGKYFASASLDKTIRLWDLDSGKVLKTYAGHEKGVLSIDFSADGYYLASGSADNTVILWEVYTGNKLYSFVDHQGPVNAVRFSPDGSYLASGSSDKSVMIWKLNKSIFSSYHFQDEIDNEIGESDLFGPKRKEESKQQFAEREDKARQAMEEIDNRYYQKYLKIRKEQRFEK
ncbi:MAG TPA: WD40 repeat domain-containing protein [Bacteroidales bacterium]|nr:WD40 repeat domain-containing protein [Bacteroidales bacterium]